MRLRPDEEPLRCEMRLCDGPVVMAADGKLECIECGDLCGELTAEEMASLVIEGAA